MPLEEEMGRVAHVLVETVAVGARTKPNWLEKILHITKKSRANLGLRAQLDSGFKPSSLGFILPVCQSHSLLLQRDFSTK